MSARLVLANVVLANLAYLVGAVVLAIVLGLAVALRHRRPKSLEANVESFTRGLRALSPEASSGRRHRRAAPPPQGMRPVRTAMPLGRSFPPGPTGPARTHDDTEAETG